MKRRSSAGRNVNSSSALNRKKILTNSRTVEVIPNVVAVAIPTILEEVATAASINATTATKMVVRVRTRLMALLVTSVALIKREVPIKAINVNTTRVAPT